MTYREAACQMEVTLAYVYTKGHGLELGSSKCSKRLIRLLPSKEGPGSLKTPKNPRNQERSWKSSGSSSQKEKLRKKPGEGHKPIPGTIL